LRIFKSNITNLTDEELMKLFIDKSNERAITELYNRYSHRLLGYFFKMFNGDKQKSQDFLQDLFVKVIEKKHQFDTSKKFYSWIFTIANNMCKTSFRKPLLQEVGDSEMTLAQLGISADDELHRKQFRKMLRGAIHQLEHHHKVVFILRYQEQFSLKEIADISEASLGTVKSRLFYATKKISEQLKDYAPENWDQLFKIS
jgi:RNA polymerase sigma-70 factor (ECF subfamily)